MAESIEWIFWLTNEVEHSRSIVAAMEAWRNEGHLADYQASLRHST